MISLSSPLKERILLASIIAGTKYSDGLADQSVSQLSDEAFTSQERVYIFNCIKMIRANRQHVNHDIILSYVTDNPASMNSNTPIELADMLTVATQTNIDTLVRELSDYQRAREIKMASIGASQIIDNAFLSEDGSTENLRATMVDYVNAVNDVMVNSATTSTGAEIGGYIGGFYDELSVSAADGGIIGVSFGIQKLDYSMGGLRPSETCVVAALPGMGKTQLMMSLIAKSIIMGGSPLMFSVEMRTNELIGRLVSCMTALLDSCTPLEYSKIRNASRLQTADYNSMELVTDLLKTSGFYVDDSATITVDDIRATAHKRKRDGKLDFIVVDYLQLMVQNEKDSASELSHITKELKKIAKEFSVPVFELSQMNVRDLRGGRPNIGHLKGSGSLEANADCVVFPWREYALSREGDPSEMDLLIGKGRAFDGRDIEAHFCTSTLLIGERPEGWVRKDNREPF